MSTIFAKEQFQDFTQTDAFAQKGWAGYLQERAKQYQTSTPSHWMETQGPKPYGKTFINVQAHFGTGFFVKDGYEITKTILDADQNGPLVTVAKTPYDQWGRKGTRTISYNGSVGSMKPVDLPHRELKQTVLEEELEQFDTKNYCQFLNVYFQNLHQTMEPFAYLFHSDYRNIEALLLPENDAAGKIKNSDVNTLSMYSEQCPEEYASENIASAIEENTGLQGVCTILKIGISVCETMRVNLRNESSELSKKAFKEFGPKSGMFAIGNKDDAMFQKWNALYNFAPQKQTTPALV